jgi:hypothetical protein
MKNSQNWLFPVFSAALTAAVFIALGSARSSDKSFESDRLSTHDAAYGEHLKDNYKVYSLPTPVNVTFAGEEVPLDRFGVREKLDRELLVNTYWHSNTLLLFKRCNRWFPVMEPILARNGVPDDFKYLAVIESGLTNAVSPAGATGFWQFLKSTGESYGLEVNEEVDERYHVERSTEAACKYLNDAYKKFGDWALVAASYNMGMGGVNKQLDRQKVGSYWDLLLNEETSRYVYRIIAVKEILNNGTAYGFVVRKSDLYDPYEVRTVALDSSVTDLADFALSQGANYNVLKSLNPWLRQSYLKNTKKKTYTVLLPEEV